MEDDLEGALKKYDENQAIHWKNKGNEFFKSEDYQNAIQCYKKALSIDSTLSSAWNNLGFAYMKNGKVEDARNCLEKVKSLRNSQNEDHPLPSSPNNIEYEKPRRLEKPDVDRRPFWLGLFGGAIGIIVGLVFFVLGGLAFFSGNWTVLIYAIVTILFSIIGMISGIVGKSKRSGVIMVCSGIIVLLSTEFIGILATIFLVVGGYILFSNAE